MTSRAPNRIRTAVAALLLAVAVTVSGCAPSPAEQARRDRFAAMIRPIHTSLAQAMTGVSWRPGCPVPLTSLRIVRVSHVDFAGRERIGELIVHADVAEKVVAAFRSMWIDAFPIQSMQLIETYGGSDAASMAANNTSAFNCRKVAGSAAWSQHSYGRAIDINPVQNPYVAAGTVDPPAGRSYLDRRHVRPGMAVAGSPPVRAFAAAGWGWGGAWSSAKDYQHFSANGR